MSIFDDIDAPEEPGDALRLAKLPTDDLGMAERLRIRFGDLAPEGRRVAKTPDVGWCAYTDADGLWQTGHKGDAHARMYAHRTARALWSEWKAAKAELDALGEDVGDTPDPKRKALKALVGRLVKAIEAAGGSSGTNAMLAQAAPYLAMELKDFDPDTRLVCTRNGTLLPVHVGEPCLVAREGGVVTAYRRAAELKPGGRMRVGAWDIERVSETLFAIADPDGGGIVDSVTLAELKAGIARGEHRLGLPLTHLDIQLLPHQPGHLITRQTAVAWNPAAACPMWREHIETVLPDRDMRDFFHRAMGYGLVGDTAAQCFIFHQGKGADGKSTTFRVIMHVLGSYGRTVDPRSWLEAKNARSAAEASPDIATMAGDTRMIYCEEPPKGSRINEGLLKQVSGGMEMQARHLGKDLFTFNPRFHVNMAFNDLPRVSGGDDGFWRRMRLVRFTRQFTEEEQRLAGDVAAKIIAAESEGVLNWLLEGLALYLRKGLQTTPAMAEDILAWRSASDPLGEWLRERTVKEIGAKTLNPELYRDYKEWCEGEQIDGREILGTKGFSNRMESLQYPLRKIGGNRYRIGLKLAPKDDLAGGGRDREDDY